MCCDNMPEASVLYHLFGKVVPVLEKMVEMQRFPINLGEFLGTGCSRAFNRNEVTQ